MANCLNVSKEYFSTSIKIVTPIQNIPVYLGCFIREKFVPIDVSFPLEDSLVFNNNVEDKNIYILAYLQNNNFLCVSPPFLFKESEKTINVKIKSKYPLFEWNKERLLRVVNATVEGSNALSFVPSERLLIIDTPSVAYNKKEFNTKKAFR